MVWLDSAKSQVPLLLGLSVPVSLPIRWVGWTNACFLAQIYLGAIKTFPLLFSIKRQRQRQSMSQCLSTVSHKMKSMVSGIFIGLWSQIFQGWLAGPSCLMVVPHSHPFHPTPHSLVVIGPFHNSSHERERRENGWCLHFLQRLVHKAIFIHSL